jgi:thiol-disulfide isomerase/thioredoxin
VYIATHADSIPEPITGAVPLPTQPRTPPQITFIPPTMLPSPTITPDPLLDQPVMDFSFTMLGGESMQVDDLRGQVLFLNFWATWCIPCRDEMPLLQSLEDDYDTVRVLAVTNIDEAQTEADIQAFVDQFDLSLLVGITSDPKVYEAFDAVQIPMTLIIDAEGVVRFRHIGALHEDDIAAYLGLLGVE